MFKRHTQEILSLSRLSRTLRLIMLFDMIIGYFYN
jgi:hypothetical protein